MLKATIDNLLQKARDVYAVANSLRYDVFRDSRSMSGHKGYTPFIKLGRSRSGSNFLRGLLYSHLRVIAFGELFQNTEAISWGLSGNPDSPQLLAQFRKDPVAFLEARVFC